MRDSQATLELFLKMRDQASDGFHHAAQQAEQYNKQVEKAQDANQGFLKSAASFAVGGIMQKGLEGLLGGIGAVKNAMIGGNAEFERYETQFGVLLKSSEKAKDRLKELSKFGATTPFELPELVRADKVLTAFGLDTEETAKKFKVSGAQIRTTIGDVAAGTGTSFEELSLQFGKFASGATGEAIARFQELGIATKQEMADWGLQFSKAGQLLTPVDEAFTVLESHVREKFGGMMDAQSKTFEGILSNLQDWMGQAGRILGKPIFDVAKNGLSGLVDFLNTLTTAGPGGISTLQKVADAEQHAIDTMKNFGTGVTDKVKDFFNAFERTGTLNPLTVMASSLKDITDIMWNKFIPGLRDIAGGDGVSGVEKLRDAVGGLRDRFADLVRNGGDLGSVAQTIANNLGDGLKEHLAEQGGKLKEGVTEAIHTAFGTPDPTAGGEIIDFLIGLLPGGSFLRLGEHIAKNVGLSLPNSLPSGQGAVQGWLDQIGQWLSPDNIAKQFENLRGGAHNLWDWITSNDTVNATANSLTTWAQGIVTWITQTGIPEISQDALALGTALNTWVNGAVQAIPGLLQQWTLVAATFIFGTVIPAIETVAGILAAAFNSWIDKALIELPGKLDQARVMINNWFSSQTPVAQVNATAMFATWDAAVENVHQTLQHIPGFIDEMRVSSTDKLHQFFTAIIGFGTSNTQPVTDSLAGGFVFAAISIPSRLLKLKADIEADLLGILGSIIRWGNDTIGEFQRFFNALPIIALEKLNELQVTVLKFIATFAVNLLNKSKAAGGNIITGLWEGVQAKWNLFVAQLQSTVGSIPDIVNRTLQINSPAKKLVPSGEAIPEGLALGMKNKWGGFEDDLVQGLGRIVPKSAPSAAAAGITLGTLITSKIAEAAKTGSADAVAAIADVASKLASAAGDLATLGGFPKVSQQGLDNFFDLLDQFTVRANARLQGWVFKFDEFREKFALEMSKTVKDIADTVQPLGTLNTFIQPLPAQMDAFFTTLDLFTDKAAGRLQNWVFKFDEFRENFAKYMSLTVKDLGDTIAPLKTLSEFLAPSPVQIDRFFDALDQFAAKANERLQGWVGKFDEFREKFAQEMSKTVVDIANAIGPLTSLADKLSPAPFQIDNFFAALDEFVTQFNRHAADWKAKMGDEVGEFAANIGTIVQGMGAAIEPLLKMAEAQKITPEQIEGTLANVWLALHHFNEVMKSGELQGDWADRAVTFAGAILAVFQAIGQAIQFLMDKENPDGIVGLWLGGMNKIFDHLIHAWGPQMKEQLGNWLQQFDNLFHNYVDDMVNYWNDRMASLQMPTVPVGSTGTSTLTGDTSNFHWGDQTYNNRSLSVGQITIIGHSGTSRTQARDIVAELDRVERQAERVRMRNP